jgi:hypothetical protein
MEAYIPLITGFIGALIGAAASIATVWVQARIADRRARYQQAVEMGMQEWSGHMAAAAASMKGKPSGVFPPAVYFQTNAGILKAYEDDDTLTPERLNEVYDEADELMEAVIEREAKRQLAGAEARARTQAREQTLPSKVKAPLHGSSSGKENTISNVTRSEE